MAANGVNVKAKEERFSIKGNDFVLLAPDSTERLHKVRVSLLQSFTNPVAGANTEIQFNNNGVFGASPNLTWNGSLLSILGKARISTVDNSTPAIKLLGVDANGNVVEGDGLILDGSGTLNYLPKWTPDGTTLGNSLIFDNGTNVGIGTTIPSEKLQVQGNIFVTNDILFSHNSALREYSSSPNRGLIYDANGSSGLWRGTHLFRVGYENANTRTGLIIKANADASTSNVGINTLTPTAQLHIAADSALSTRTVFQIRNSADSGNILEVNGVGDLSLGENGTGINLKSPDGTNYKLTVDNAGNLVIT